MIVQIAAREFVEVIPTPALSLAPFANLPSPRSQTRILILIPPKNVVKPGLVMNATRDSAGMGMAAIFLVLKIARQDQIAAPV